MVSAALCVQIRSIGMMIQFAVNSNSNSNFHMKCVNITSEQFTKIRKNVNYGERICKSCEESSGAKAMCFGDRFILNCAS